MMLNIRILEVYSTFSIYLPLAIFLCIIFFIQLFFVYFKSFSVVELGNSLNYINWVLFTNVKINLIGQLLFNEYFILFIAATLLLFIAMIGVITLVLNKNEEASESKLNYRIKFSNINWKYIK
jgi:NADH:ubiquinone oxidoreductase subunit 6 (subunit J)